MEAYMYVHLISVYSLAHWLTDRFDWYMYKKNEKKPTLLLFCPLKGQRGGGSQSLADMYAKKSIFFLLTPSLRHCISPQTPIGSQNHATFCQAGKLGFCLVVGWRFMFFLYRGCLSFLWYVLVYYACKVSHKFKDNIFSKPINIVYERVQGLSKK